MPRLPFGSFEGRLREGRFVDVRNLRGGIITAQTIILAGGTKGAIRSQNYNGTDGWAIFGDGSAFFGGDVVFGADLYSSNWVSGGGALPADLTSRDSNATTGYYLDHSTGAAQFVKIYADTGELRDLTILGTLTLGTGGLFRSAASGLRIEIDPAFDDMIRFYTDHASETFPGQVAVDIIGDTGAVSIEGPVLGGGFSTIRVSNDKVLGGFILFDTIGSPGGAFTFRIDGTQTFQISPAKVDVGNFVTPADLRVYGDLEVLTGSTREFSVSKDGVGYVSVESGIFSIWNVLTTGTAANANFTGFTGRYLLRRVTSARKYKTQIDYAVDYLADIKLKPAKFYRNDDERWFLGFIADDFGEQDKLLGVYEDDTIESYDHAAVMAVMAAKINRLEKQMAQLLKRQGVL